jgi:hypothetical protein
MRSRAGSNASAAARLVPVTAVLAVVLGCGGAKEPAPDPGPPPKVFPSPVFDRLSLGMTRDDVSRLCSIRPTVTSGGRNLRVWACQRQGEYTMHLTFTGGAERDALKRIDVHYGPTDEEADAFIARLEPRYGTPDIRRRQAVINSYGDKAHRQFETIWSDATQYVFLTERVPMPGKPGKPVYYLTVRRKELTTTGPPTGYVPPPALDEEGNPVEEPVF